MVKISVAGGSGQVSREVIDALVAAGKHEITILSRKEAPEEPIARGVIWYSVDYHNKDKLAEALVGTHTLLSFVQTLSDPDQISQRNLIDAAIAAGVSRFAPSEFGSAGTVDMPWVEGKRKIREYLEEVNNSGKVLEYTLFQPGLFLDYLAYPFQTTKYIDPLQLLFDFEERSAVVIDGHEDAVVTLTSAADLAAIVVRAVDYEGTWPKVGGIRGNRLTYSQIIELGNRIRVYIADNGLLRTREYQKEVPSEGLTEGFSVASDGALTWVKGNLYTCPTEKHFSYGNPVLDWGIFAERPDAQLPACCTEITLKTAAV
ncbi:Oxidoreductase BOA1 [Paramyrothecium foliicola]|nr:Oxidoreductase BOA1 [Paramyrothecium foliicola]